MSRVEPDPSELEPSESQRALRWLHRERAEQELVLLVAGRVRRRRQRRRALLGALCLALVVGGLSWRERGPSSGERGVRAVAQTEPASATVTTPRRETLPDGSVVDFREGAEIQVAFSDVDRRVTLLRGQAHFQVRKDAARPFIVLANHVAVRAVGTAFSVQMDDTGVEVLVTEGRVALDSPRVEREAAALEPGGNKPADPLPVEPESFAELPAALLDAGHRARIPTGAAAEVVAVPAPEMVKHLSWRVPQLEFSRTPLVEVVALINRYAEEYGRTPVRIHARSEDLEQLRLSGYLAADNVPGLVRLLESQFQVRAEFRATEIVLHSSR